jgi:hypothetical protein
MQSPFTALLLSREALTVETMDNTFDAFGIDADLCLSAPTAQRLLTEREFDLLVLDFDTKGATNVLDFQGNGAHTLPSAVIAIMHELSAVKTNPKRVCFEVQKPFTADLMAKTLKAAYSHILKEKRATLRHAVAVEASAKFTDKGERRVLSGVITDISETGMCIKTADPLPVQTTVRIAFKLPETRNRVHPTCNVTWSDAEGNASICFQSIPALEQRDLQRWLDARCPWDPELIPRAAQSRHHERAAF